MRVEIVKATAGAPRRGRRAMGAVVSAARAAAAREADRVLTEASAEAEMLVAGARRDAEALLERARAEGDERGERAWAEAAAALAAAAAGADRRRERECVRLAIEIARRIVGELALSDAAAMEEVAERVCAPLRRDAPLRVTVSSRHAARAESLRARLGAWPAADVLTSDALGPADCLAECGGVRVDGRLDVQLGVIEERLLSARGGGDD